MPTTLPRNALVKPRSKRAAPRQRTHAHHPWWPFVKRILTIVFFATVTLLLVRYARNMDWREVSASVRDTPAPTLLLAGVLAAGSHLLYSSFDLFGRRYTDHELSTRTVMAVTFISYAFNLCIGSIIGGVALRYRLYSHFGLGKGVIARVVTMSMLTNWLGYMLLAGLVFLAAPLQLPPSWKMSNYGLQWVGGALVLAAAAYVAACVRAGDRVWTVRGHELFLPPWRMTVQQLAISCLNWAVMAGVIFALLQRAVPYSNVLTVLLIAAVTGVIVHVPAGLGVFEFVFIALLSHQVSEGRLLAALLGFRAIYYIVPLMVATVLYLAMEARARQRRRS